MRVGSSPGVSRIQVIRAGPIARMSRSSPEQSASVQFVAMTSGSPSALAQPATPASNRAAQDERGTLNIDMLSIEPSGDRVAIDGLILGRTGGPRAERDLELGLLSVALHHHFDLIARLLAAEGFHELFDILDLLAAEP